MDVESQNTMNQINQFISKSVTFPAAVARPLSDELHFSYQLQICHSELISLDRPAKLLKSLWEECNAGCVRGSGGIRTPGNARGAATKAHTVPPVSWIPPELRDVPRPAGISGCAGGLSASRILPDVSGNREHPEGANAHPKKPSMHSDTSGNRRPLNDDRVCRTNGSDISDETGAMDLSKFTCETYFGGGAIARTQLFVADMVFNMNMVLTGHVVPANSNEAQKPHAQPSARHVESTRPDCITAAFREYAMARTPFVGDLITVIGGCPIDGGSIEMSTQYLSFHEAPRLQARYVRHGHECIAKMKYASTVIIDRHYSYEMLHGQENIRYFANGAMLTEITNPWNRGLLCGTVSQVMISSKNGILYQTSVRSVYSMGNHIQTNETIALYTG